MQLKLIPAAIALALLAACGGQDAPAPASAPVAAPAPAAAPAQPQTPQFSTAVTGELQVAGLAELPPGFQLSVRLLDVSDPSQVPPVVAELNTPAPSMLPGRFSLPYDPAKISEEGRYAVLAALVIENVPLYSSPAPTPVLTHGNANRVSLELVRGGGQADTQIAPTEKMKQEFASLERSIGGFKRVTGERMDDDITVGWDAFIAGGQVRFAREQVDYGDAGSASFRYAFQGGKPWVIVREQRGRSSWLGWNADGELILNEGERGAVIEPAEAERLRAQAAEVMSLAARGG